MVCFFSYKVDSWGCVDLLCCLAGIFASVLGFFVGIFGDFIGNLQRDLFVLFGLDFCWFFGFLWVLKDIFL